MEKSPEEIGCIAEHPEFGAICLNPWVLNSSNNMRRISIFLSTSKHLHFNTGKLIYIIILKVVHYNLVPNKLRRIIFQDT